MGGMRHLFGPRGRRRTRLRLACPISSLRLQGGLGRTRRPPQHLEVARARRRDVLLGRGSELGLALDQKRPALASDGGDADRPVAGVGVEQQTASRDEARR